MAPFNPQFSSPDPSYLGWSKPSSQPEADKSTGIALKAAGDAFEEGVALTDTTIKGVIRDDIATQSDKQKQDFLDQLQQFKTQYGTANPLNSNAAATDQDLMPDKGTDAPKDVTNALAKVQTINDAKEQGSKFRTTSLDANLTDTLKDIRSRYPGYRDYIDEQASRIIGYNPANKLISDQIAQLNEQTSNARKEQDFWEKQIVNSGFDKSSDVLNQFRQDHNIAAVQNYLAKNNSAVEGVKRQISDFNLSNAKAADVQTKAENAAYALSDHAATAYFMNRGIVDENGVEGPSSDQISTKLQQLQASPNGRDAEAIRNAGMQLEALRQRNQLELMTQLRNQKNSDGRSIYDTLGPKRVNEIVNETIGKYYDAQHRGLTDGNLGLVFAVQNAGADVVNNAAFKVLKNPTLSGIATTGAVLNKLMPNLSPGLMEEVNKTYSSGGGTGAAGIASDLVKLSNQQFKQGLAQTGGTSASGPNGTVYTFKQAQDEQDRAQQATHATDQQKVQAINNVLKLKQSLVEKDPRAVDAGIAFFYDPSNRGSLSKYMDDYYDKSTNTIKKGRTGAFQDLTTPDITKSVWDRSLAGNGTAWEFYKSWARGEAIPALTTIAKTWNTNEVQYENNKTIHGAEGDMPSGTDHHFYWDTDKHQIGITDLRGQPLNIEDTWRQNPDIFAVRNANVMLRSLSNIAKQEGTEPNAFAFKVLKDAGWAPPSLDTRGTSTVSDLIIKAIVQAHTPPAPDSKENK